MQIALLAVIVWVIAMADRTNHLERFAEPPYWEQIGDDRYPVQQFEPPTVLGFDPMSLLGARLGLRTPQAAVPRGPWSPRERPTNITREWKQPGDDSIPQHVYEALLGRTRRPGAATAQPGSGWWTVGPLHIPKPTNPLPWVGAGGVGYGIWRLGGGPEAWEGLTRSQGPLDHPWQYLWNDIRDAPASYRNYMQGLEAAERLGIYRFGDRSESADRLRNTIVNRGLPIIEGPRGEQY